MKIKRKEEQVIKKTDDGLSSITFYTSYYKYFLGKHIAENIVLFEEVSGEKEWIIPYNDLWTRAI